MATVTKHKFSNSSGGKPILITATNSTGSLTLHTCVSSTGPSTWDEVYLWAYNNSTGTRKLTVRFGTTSAMLATNLTGLSGMSWILPGQPGNNGLVVRAFASSGASVVVDGWVNRISS